MAHHSCRSKNRAVLSQSAERLDRALQFEPVRVKANGHTRTSCSAHQCDASQQKGERIAWKLGVSHGGILHKADPRLRTDGGTDQSGAQHEIVDAACGYRVLGRKLQFAPPSLRPGGASAPIRSAVAHRNPSTRQTGSAWRARGSLTGPQPQVAMRQATSLFDPRRRGRSHVPRARSREQACVAAPRCQ